jgi:hypothetical protein
MKELKEICPLIKKATVEGIFKEWEEKTFLPNGMETYHTRNSISVYTCDPECAKENNCRTNRTLCPIPHNCYLFCAIENNCLIQTVL